MGNASADASWIAGVSKSAVPTLQPHLHPYLTTLVDDVDGKCPGRTAAIIDAVIRGTLRLDCVQVPAELSDAESVVAGIAEQFVIDVQGVDDEAFGRLKAHYQEPEIVAMLFRMALSDGLAKLEKVA